MNKIKLILIEKIPLQPSKVLATSKNTHYTPSALLFKTAVSWSTILLRTASGSLSAQVIAVFACLSAAQPTSVSCNDGILGWSIAAGIVMSGTSMSWYDFHSCINVSLVALLTFHALNSFGSIFHFSIALKSDTNHTHCWLGPLAKHSFTFSSTTFLASKARHSCCCSVNFFLLALYSAAFKNSSELIDLVPNV